MFCFVTLRIHIKVLKSQTILRMFISILTGNIHIDFNYIRPINLISSLNYLIVINIFHQFLFIFWFGPTRLRQQIYNLLLQRVFIVLTSKVLLFQREFNYQLTWRRFIDKHLLTNTLILKEKRNHSNTLTTDSF